MMTEQRVELPAELIQQLVSLGLQTQGGQLIVQTVLQLHPALREAVASVGAFRVACQEGWLMPGDAGDAGDAGERRDPALPEQNGNLDAASAAVPD